MGEASRASLPAPPPPSASDAHGPCTRSSPAPHTHATGLHVQLRLLLLSSHVSSAPTSLAAHERRPADTRARPRGWSGDAASKGHRVCMGQGRGHVTAAAENTEGKGEREACGQIHTRSRAEHRGG